MQHTRRLTTGAVAVLTALMLMLPASAHGGRHHQAAAQTPVTNCGVCAVETCHTSGRHTHSGVTYCGAEHARGWCDGTCPYYQAPASSGVRYGGHHGCR